MTSLLEFGDDELEASTAFDDVECVSICSSRGAEVHGTRGPQGGSTIGGALSVPDDSTHYGACGKGHSEGRRSLHTLVRGTRL
jgi:hypothetical protein